VVSRSGRGKWRRSWLPSRLWPRCAPVASLIRTGGNGQGMGHASEGHQCTPEEIQAVCREHLAAYKVPRLVEFCENLPKTMVGKVLRRALIEQHRSKQPDSTSIERTQRMASMNRKIKK